MSATQIATRSSGTQTPPRQAGHRLGNYLDIPAILGSFLMLLLGWVEVTGKVAHAWHNGIAVLFWLCWGCYVAEYTAKVAISRDKAGYVRDHPLDLVTAICPFVGFIRAFKGMNGPPLTAANLAILKRRQLDKLAIITVQVVFIAAVIELLLEQHAGGSNITNWVDALYWSATTVTTVASQFAPVTTGGEIVSFLLMLYAVLVFTYLMSALASALIGGDASAAGEQEAQGLGQGSQPPADGAVRSDASAGGDTRTVALTKQEIATLSAILDRLSRP